jgi:amicyanin
MKTSLVRGLVAATVKLALLTATVAPLALSPAPSWAAEAAADKAGEATVMIDNFTFNPPRITVKAGTTITWTNDDDIPHTVASSTKAFKSKVLDTEEKFSFTFTTPGTFEYFCSLHPHMVGTVVVEAVTGSNAAK